MRFVVYRDHAGEWRWRLVAANGKTIADSAEGYARRDGARRAVRRLRDRLYIERVPIGVEASKA